MKQRQLNVSKETIKNEKDLKRLLKGKSIQISRDDIYARALKIKLAAVANTYGDTEILDRLRTPYHE